MPSVHTRLTAPTEATSITARPVMQPVEETSAPAHRRPPVHDPALSGQLEPSSTETIDAEGFADDEDSPAWRLRVLLPLAILVGIGGGALLFVTKPWQRSPTTTATATQRMSPTQGTSDTPEATTPTPSVTGTPPLLAVRFLGLTSSPTRGLVTINGEKLGLTPLSDVEVSGLRSLKIVVERRGYLPWRRTIPAGTGRIELSARLIKRRRAPVRTAIPVERGQGTLVLNADPWATVYIDGKRIQNTPLLGYKLTAGTHTIKLVNSELKITRTLTVKIQVGKSKRLIVDMRQKSPGVTH